MLINLTPNKTEEERRRAISVEHGFEYIPQSDPKFLQETGIYQSACSFNFPKEEFKEFEGHSWRDEVDMCEGTGKCTYGVADTIEQVKEYFKEEIEDPHKKYVIALTPVGQDKDNRGNGGWRWHKWGEYIGVLNPKCEYLDDEDFGDNFRYVICFEIHPIRS